MLPFSEMNRGHRVWLKGSLLKITFGCTSFSTTPSLGNADCTAADALLSFFAIVLNYEKCVCFLFLFVFIYTRVLIACSEACARSFSLHHQHMHHVFRRRIEVPVSLLRRTVINKGMEKNRIDSFGSVWSKSPLLFFFFSIIVYFIWCMINLFHHLSSP